MTRTLGPSTVIDGTAILVGLPKIKNAMTIREMLLEVWILTKSNDILLTETFMWWETDNERKIHTLTEVYVIYAM